MTSPKIKKVKVVKDFSNGAIVRNIGQEGTGWKFIISDGYCSYRWDLSGIHDKHCINSLAKILIKASKTRFKQLTSKGGRG